MRVGSWRDAGIGRIAQALLAAGAAALLFALVPSDLLVSVLLLVACGALAAFLLRLRARRSAAGRASHRSAVHPGINVSHIAPAGFPGMIFALGMVAMFWFGVPGFRPVVVAAAALGLLVGGALIAVELRHRPPSATPLGLSATPASSEEDGPSRGALSGPQNKSMNQTKGRS
jgi:hypothetical protein